MGTDGPSLASDDVLRGETLSAIELRHELELAEVKKTTAHMTGKKEQMDVLRIEGLVTDRQYLETRRWEELRKDDEDEEGAKKEEAEKKDDVAPPVAAMKSVSLSSAGDDEDDGKKHETLAQAKGETSGMTKAMKRRVKKKTRNARGTSASSLRRAKPARATASSNRNGYARFSRRWVFEWTKSRRTGIACTARSLISWRRWCRNTRRVGAGTRSCAQ